MLLFCLLMKKNENSEWYTGTANAIYQNLEYMESYNPEYVLILSGDHIYKMDYEVMLDFHKQNGSECTIAVMPVPMEEAKRFGIMITDENKRIVDFEEKPANPRSNLASMGIYIFNWKTLKQALIDNADQPNLDFGKHVIPYCHKNGAPMYAYEFNGYWKDVGTLTSYWEANMELIDVVRSLIFMKNTGRFIQRARSCLLSTLQGRCNRTQYRRRRL